MQNQLQTRSWLTALKRWLTVTVVAVALGGLTTEPVQAFPKFETGDRSSTTLSSLLDRCCDDPVAEMQAFADELAAADDLAVAQQRALAEIALAERATRVAARIMPRSDTVTDLDARLGVYRERVETAESPQMVAAAFQDLAQPKSQLQDGASVGKCDYTRTEVIIIIIGFVLGIIPGIIFLFVFC